MKLMEKEVAMEQESESMVASLQRALGWSHCWLMLLLGLRG
jgi:hypothetical protein